MMFWKKSVTNANGSVELKAVAVSAANPLPVNATVTAEANTVAVATAAAPTYSEGATESLSMDLNGALRVGGTISASSSIKSTAADPSYSEGATTNPLSCDLLGYQRVKAKQSGTWSVGIDQTTPGTTNLVDCNNFPDTLDVNSGSKSNSTIRVVLATDQPALTNKLLVTPDLPSGASTAAKQPALGTAGTASSDVITVQGIASMTALKVDGSAVTQPVSVADGSAVTIGSKTDAKSTATDTTSVSMMQVLKQISASVQAPPSQAVTNAGTFATQATLQAGSALVGNVGHGKTIKTVSGSLTADTDVIAAVTSKRIKVIAYRMTNTGTSANAAIFKSNGTGGTEVWREFLQGASGAPMGVQMTMPAPSWIFATAAGEKLTLDVGNTDTVHYSITYFDDDAS